MMYVIAALLLALGVGLGWKAIRHGVVTLPRFTVAAPPPGAAAPPGAPPAAVAPRWWHWSRWRPHLKTFWKQFDKTLVGVGVILFADLVLWAFFPAIHARIYGWPLFVAIVAAVVFGFVWFTFEGWVRVGINAALAFLLAVSMLSILLTGWEWQNRWSNPSSNPNHTITASPTTTPAMYTTSQCPGNAFELMLDQDRVVKVSEHQCQVRVRILEGDWVLAYNKRREYLGYAGPQDSKVVKKDYFYYLSAGKGDWVKVSVTLCPPFSQGNEQGRCLAPPAGAPKTVGDPIIDGLASVIRGVANDPWNRR